MKNKGLLLLALVILFGAVSCKKETASKPALPNSTLAGGIQSFYFSDNKLICG